MAKIDELNQKYSELCAQLGDTIFKIVALENKRNGLLIQISEIEKQAKESDEKR